MPYEITDECIGCGKCSPVCPVGAINEGESYFRIDATLCNDCSPSYSPLCKQYCPVPDCIRRIES